VNPVVAMLLGAWIGESIDLRTAAAMVLVIAGVAVTIAARNRPAQLVPPGRACAGHDSRVSVRT
jgi:drug/metabolite transporter (DMT)-like permease